MVVAETLQGTFGHWGVWSEETLICHLSFLSLGTVIWTFFYYTDKTILSFRYEDLLHVSIPNTQSQKRCRLTTQVPIQTEKLHSRHKDQARLCCSKTSWVQSFELSAWGLNSIQSGIQSANSLHYWIDHKDYKQDGRINIFHMPCYSWIQIEIVQKLCKVYKSISEIQLHTCHLICQLQSI